MIEIKELGVLAPDGCIIGVIADRTEGLTVPILEHPFATASVVEKSLGVVELRRRADRGETLIVVSHDELLLESLSDEIWVIREGKLIDRGDPGEVLRRYRADVAQQLRALGQDVAQPLSPSMRKGDGRASIDGVDLLGEGDAPTNVWRSGEEVSIRVRVQFHAAVSDPVVGIMIRTRIGLHVYGTNTELEGIHFGPVAAGDERNVIYKLHCELCPGEYTVTAASHDPDGLWHEWLEDAVAFTVTDTRYTAGVANLRARVSVE